MEQCFPDDDWCYAHDGASAHKADMINRWLEDNVPDHITSGPSGDWPASSPDLNPIENIWGIMNESIQLDSPATTAALKRSVKKAWANIPLSTLQSTIQSMPNRLAQVIHNQGESIGK